MKIVILGYSGSGKSTLARNLAKHYDLPALHLDQVQFLPNWQVRDTKEAQNIVLEFISQENWVIDGTYSHYVLNERLATADQIIFMNFSRITCLFRVFKRFLKYHGTNRPDMTTGCNEKIDGEFLWWLLYEGRTKQKRQEFAAISQRFSKKMVVLNNQKELDQFYQQLATHTDSAL